MRYRSLALLAVVSLIPVAAAAAEGDLDTGYGNDGRAVIDAISTTIGVGELHSDGEGRAVITFSGDPESGGAALVSADGTDIVMLTPTGPTTAVFGPGSRLYAASDESGVVAVARYLIDGAPDVSFGTGGRAVVDVEPAVHGALVADADGVVVAGGVFSPDRPEAWAARFDLTGQPDAGFGTAGVATLVSEDPGTADLVVPTGIHPTSAGYVAVVLTRALSGDNVTVVGVDHVGAVGASRQLAFDDEIFAVASTSLEDGSVMVGVQTRAADIDTFHLLAFHADGSFDPGFSDPELTDDEVGGRLHLAQIRTGEVIVAYNRGPEPEVAIRMVSDQGSELDALTPDVGAVWMYGLTTLTREGRFLMAVDETPVSSQEPDDLTLVKLVSDESGRFIDDDASAHEADVEALAGLGITKGCNPPADSRFCPDAGLVRGEMAALMVRGLDLAAGTEDAFTDDDGSIFEDDINRLAEAGITRGCNPPVNSQFCPLEQVTRGQLAAFMVRALRLSPATGDAFTDDDGSIFEDDINRLAAAGITKGCDPPQNTRFCPNATVSRAEMATLLLRALAQR